MSPTQVIILIAVVWHAGLAALVAWLYWSRRSRGGPVWGPAVPNSPAVSLLTGARQEWTVQGIKPPRLVRLIFKSHAVFGLGIEVWQGTAEELLTRLSGAESMLNAWEKSELPDAAGLAYRFGRMMEERGHYLRIELHDPVGAEPRTWRLSLNPEARRS